MAKFYSNDLTVERISHALAGKELDVVVSGSIGAVESVRFVRALRRLGAEITPWLTAGGAQFITPLALSWASGRETRTAFQGDASHIALAHAVVVAPASASLIGKIAHGLTDTPAAALVTSYLGQGKPVLLLPNMHDSLADAPAVKHNLEMLRRHGVHLLQPRLEEDKRKFPEPAELADLVSHLLNKAHTKQKHVLVTMGSTRGYIDEVRYVSNYSSGRLGSEISEELFRLGYGTDVVAGPSPVKPRSYSQLVPTLTNDDMAKAAKKFLSDGASAAVLAASVLDFTPKTKASGKISTKDHPSLSVDMTRTPKIIADINPASGVKVGFKLETGLTEAKAKELAERYVKEFKLSLFVINDLADVDQDRHKALVFDGAKTEVIDGKHALALRIARHVHERLSGATATP